MHEDVQTAEVPLGGVEEGTELDGVGHIGPHDDGPPAGPLDPGRDILGGSGVAAIVHDDPRPVGGQP